MIAPVNPVISQGQRKGIDTGFHYNKDADTFVCPAGELAKCKYYQKPKEKKTDADGKIFHGYTQNQTQILFPTRRILKMPIPKLSKDMLKYVSDKQIGSLCF